MASASKRQGKNTKRKSYWITDDRKGNEMSAWFDFKRDEVDIDHEGGCVDIRVGFDSSGSNYISIPVAGWLEIADEIRNHGDDRFNPDGN